jgi:hypothetical protein
MNISERRHVCVYVCVSIRIMYQIKHNVCYSKKTGKKDLKSVRAKTMSSATSSSAATHLLGTLCYKPS